MILRSLILSASVAMVANPAGPVSAQQASPSIVGVWTLNRDKSDKVPDAAQPGDRGEREGHGGGHGGGRGPGGGFGQGGRHGGGYGGGYRRGDENGGAPGGHDNAEDMQRRRQAVRDIMDAPERMTITRTESMVIITSGDGRTTRLATDGTKVKDQSTGIERKSHMEGDRLVSEINAPGGKMVETYAVDPGSHELVVSLQVEGKDRPGATPQHRVYDLQQP